MPKVTSELKATFRAFTHFTDVNQGLRGSVVFDCSALHIQQMAEEIRDIRSV